MKTLEALATRRIEASRLNRIRWDMLSIFVLVIAITSIISIGVSFWIFFVAETPHLGSFRAGRTPQTHPHAIGQTHPFVMNDLNQIRSILDRTKQTTFIYPGLPSECTKQVPDWVREVSSVARDDDYDQHWSYSAKVLLVIVSANQPCTVEALNNILDSDPLSAGTTIVWIGGSSTDHVPQDHLRYPESFLLREATHAPDLAGEKDRGRVWNAEDQPLELIGKSQFCMYDQQHLWLEIVHGCIPVVNDDVSKRIPLSGLIFWDTIVVKFSMLDLNGDVTSRRNALSAVREYIDAIPDRDLILHNLAFN